MNASFCPLLPVHFLILMPRLNSKLLFWLLGSLPLPLAKIIFFGVELPRAQLQGVYCAIGAPIAKN